MHINWKGAKEFFSDCSFNFNHPHMSVHRQRETQLKKTLYMETFPLGHMKSMRSTPVCVCVCVCARVCVWETQVVLLWGRQHERPWQFQISCCRWIFINNICQWNIPSLCLCVCVCVCVSYYFASRPSGMCRFQKNSSSIFMRVYAFINVAANCLRSNSQLVSASTRVYLTDRERKKKVCVCVRVKERRRVIRGGDRDGENKGRARNCYRWPYVSSRWKGDFEKRTEKIIQMRREGEGKKAGGQEKKKEKRGEVKRGEEKRREVLRYLSYFGLTNEPKVSWICPESPEAQLDHPALLIVCVCVCVRVCVFSPPCVWAILMCVY